MFPIKNSDMPYGIYVIIEGKFKRLLNIFQVKNIFLPTLAPQKSFFKDYVSQDGVSFSNKQILVMSEPNI